MTNVSSVVFKPRLLGLKPPLDSALYDDMMDRWSTGDFTAFSTVFLPFQDDGRLVVKGCALWNPVYGCKDFRRQVISKSGLLHQLASAEPTELPGLLLYYTCSQNRQSTKFQNHENINFV